MSCFSCTRSYGFFCKESGCPNCGFSFCSKCLKKCIEVPRCNNQKLKVCLKCFEKLEKELKIKLTVDPKEEEILNITNSLVDLAPVLEPISPSAIDKSKSNDDIATNLDLDGAISLRLKNLKFNNDSNNLPTDSDLANRLADLKGVPFKEYSKTDILLSTDERTEKEKIDDLLKQFVEEAEIDNNQSAEVKNDPLVEIEKRLAALRGEEYVNKATEQSNQKYITDSPSDNEDDEAIAKKIVKKYLDQANLLEVSISEIGRLSKNHPSNPDLKELPWCTICNDDATKRCVTCGGDLFCNSCFKECHDDEDFRKHESQNYKNKCPDDNN